MFGSAAPILLLLLPLTGDFSTVGLRMKQGIELAVAQAQEQGLQVSLWTCDTAGDPAVAKAYWASLGAAPDVKAVIGPLTHAELKAMSEVSFQACPVISPTAWSDQPGGWFVNLPPALEGAELGSLILRRWPTAHVGVLMSQEAYSREAVKGLIRSSLRPTVVVTYTQGDMDLRDPFLRMGGIDIEDVKRDMDTDRRWFRARVLKMGRRVFEGVDLPTPAGSPSQPPAKVKVVLFQSVLEGPRVLQEDFDVELVKGVREAYVQERGWSVESRSLPKGDLQEAALAACSESEVVAVVAPVIKEYPLPVERWVDACRGFVWPFPRIRQLPVLVVLEWTVWMKGREAPEVYQTAMSLMPKRVSNPLGLDAVYAPGDWEEGLQQLAQLRFYDLTLPVLGSQRWHRPEFVKNLSKYPVDIWVPSVFFAEADRAAMRQFSQAFEKRFVELPDRYALLGYDAAGMGLAHVRRGAPTVNAMAGERWEYDGVAGRVVVEGGIVTQREFLLLTAKQGQWMEYIWP